jgi:hypothetical protein
MTPFFWSHYYLFLCAFCVILVAANVALVRKRIKDTAEFVATILLELVVIAMIGVELKEGHDQGQVMDDLNRSAGATAATLKISA